MDCNSILYDSYYQLAKDAKQVSEHAIIQRAIQHIKQLIEMIQPTGIVYIAFDGVAPFAKMSQQRTRRYKSLFTSKIEGKPTLWNTANITPGTLFMKSLCDILHREFANKERLYKVEKIIFSGSNIPGEGEHKIFEYIRNHPCPNDEIAIYGLDSDLIMLSIFHQTFCKNIHIFRESMEFAHNIVGSKDPFYFLNIRELSASIFVEMEMDTEIQIESDKCCKIRIYDYIFLCFFLGNDFLPHFPALNIRTTGIQVLMNTYKKYIGSYSDRSLIHTNTMEIQWKWVNLLINEIAKNEHYYILEEYKTRRKWGKRYMSEKTAEEKSDLLQNVPVIMRGDEEYICPEQPNWQNRYYMTLIPKSDKIEICINYLEGLEWVFRYYTKGCPDWEWNYNYHYPPLLQDLIRHIPHENATFLKPNNSTAMHPFQQLAYVLPYAYLHLLPKRIAQMLRTDYSEYYPKTYQFKWAFCRYFWEAHPLLRSREPTVPLRFAYPSLSSEPHGFILREPQAMQRVPLRFAYPSLSSEPRGFILSEPQAKQRVPLRFAYPSLSIEPYE